MSNEGKVPPEEILYALVERALAQERAAGTALAGLAERDAALRDALCRLDALADRLLPEVKEAAKAAAKAGAETGLQDATKKVAETVEEAIKPTLASFNALAGKVEQADGKLRGTVKWFNLRWAACLVLVGAGMLLACYGMVRVIVAWQGHDLDKLKAEQAQVAADLADAQRTRDALDKHLHGLRYIEASDGNFLRIPGDFNKLVCRGGVPCAKLH